MKRQLTVIVAAALACAGCSGSGPNASGGAGLTTGSILDGKPAGNAEGLGGIKNDDPLARPIHVAWTAARAEKCGFNFDSAALRQRFLTTDGGQSAQQAYDVTFNKVRSSLASQAEYCSDGKKVADIKTSLGRHLKGDYAPDFPVPKAEVAQCGGIFGGACEAQEQKKFEASDFWRQLEDNKKGVRSQ